VPGWIFTVLYSSKIHLFHRTLSVTIVFTNIHQWIGTSLSSPKVFHCCPSIHAVVSQITYFLQVCRVIQRFWSHRCALYIRNMKLLVMLFSPAYCYLLLATNKLFVSGLSNTLVRHQSFNWKILYVFGFQTFQEERPHVLRLLWREGRFWRQPRPAVSIFGKWTTGQFDVAGSNVPNNFAMADTVRNNDTSLSHKSTSHVSTGEEEDLT
jgi:hypothetical protein